MEDQFDLLWPKDLLKNFDALLHFGHYMQPHLHLGKPPTSTDSFLEPPFVAFKDL